MSVYTLPNDIDINSVLHLVQDIREPSGLVLGNGEFQPPTGLEFQPDLTVDETEQLDALFSEAVVNFSEARIFLSDLNTAITWLDSQIELWPTLTGNQKQQWIASNFDKVLRVNLGTLRFIRWLVRAFLKLNGL
jgi:hypothetical protein